MLFRSDRKSTRLNSSHLVISYAVFCLKKKKITAQSVYIRYSIIGGVSEPVISVDAAPQLCWSSVSAPVITTFVVEFFFFFFFFNDTATTEIYTLSLHDALPIYGPPSRLVRHRAPGNGRGFP